MLRSHPDIQECAVVEVADIEWGVVSSHLQFVCLFLATPNC
ncbi:hypothetical protein [Nostoc sp.]